MDPLDSCLLPDGVRSRMVDSVNGLRMHVLEAGDPRAPSLLLLHGFPELAYSWRRLLPALAEPGFHVIAPDQRGYGRTTGWDPNYDVDLVTYAPLSLVDDITVLLDRLSIDRVASVIGHDFGSPVAGWCALSRPDLFRSVVFMSAPFALVDPVPSATRSTLAADLADLERPRKHYQHYYRSQHANTDLWHAPQGVHEFLRAYFHHKSADWPGNQPFRLASTDAAELARLPTYYVMDLGASMADTVAAEAPTADDVAANRWLPDSELAVFAAEFTRTGFQGGLNWYRATGLRRSEMATFSRHAIDQPALFVAGARDWGVYQAPGRLDAMGNSTCSDLQGVHLVDGAGHWVQQEQPQATTALVLEFLSRNHPRF